MSPEQAATEHRIVDVRSDIYSLGVILYELLTGTTPIECKELSVLSPSDVLRKVKNHYAVPPSQRLIDLDSSCDQTAKERSVTRTKLRTLIRGDLDCIVIKSLHVEPHLRFDSAKELADDISRFLRGIPIHARPISQYYRFQKFAQRNRPALIAGISFCCGVNWRNDIQFLASRSCKEKRKSCAVGVQCRTTCEER